MLHIDARFLQAQAISLRLRSHTFNNIYSNRMLPRRKHPVLVCGRTTGNSVSYSYPKIFSRGLAKYFIRLIKFPTVLENYVASLAIYIASHEIYIASHEIYIARLEIYFLVLLAKNLRHSNNFGRLVMKIGVHIFSFSEPFVALFDA